MPFAAALSQHPVAAEAVGEVLGRIVEQAGSLTDPDTGEGRHPDLVVVFASAAHVEFLGEITNAIDVVLAPTSVIGSAAASVDACGERAEDGPALAVWAAWSEPMVPMRLTATPVDEVDGEDIRVGVRFDGLVNDIAFGSTVLVLADPHTFPIGAFADVVGERHAGVSVVGGLVSASDEPRGNALVLDGTVHRDGAVAVVIGPDAIAAPLVSQGGRPVGEPMVVTRSHQNFILELAGQSALDMFHRTIDALAPDDRRLARRGVLLGVVTDEVRDDFGHGDFLVRAINGADRRAGVLAMPEPIEVGRTVQFHLQDPAAAADQLQAVLDPVAGRAALVFSAIGGPDEPGRPTIAERLDTSAVVGMAVTGAVGPIGGRSSLHAYATAMLVFSDD